MEDKKIKSLSDYKDEIHRCSKCGLCQSVCPVFKVTGNECTVSRGQFIMLDGIVSGKLKMSANINKYLDMCLKCDKCSEFCPSDINVVDILLSAKHEYFKNSIEGKIYGFLESKPVFNTILGIKKLLFNICTPRKKSKNFATKAVYFGGCVSDTKTENFVTELLNKMHIETVKTNCGCCGMPFLTTGNTERFIEQAQENISKLPDDVEYIVTNCASCEYMWNSYSKFVSNEKLNKIKIVSIYDLIVNNDISFTSKKHKIVTYHKPCHENHSDSVLNIIRNIKNTEYKELEGMDECCGFASYEHPASLNITTPILKNKKENIKKTNSDCVITTCAGCNINLNILTLGKSRDLLAFLRKHCNIN